MERLRRSDALSGEIAANLQGAGFALGTVDRVLDRLRSNGLLNDVRTIDHFVSARSGKRSAGVERMREDLMKRGAPQDLVEERLSVVGFENQLAGMRAILEVRCKTSDNRAKGARCLLSKGFSEGEIKDALDDFFGAEDYPE